MIKNLSLSLIALGGICLLNACADHAPASPTKPANCGTARRDMTMLQEENAKTVEKQIAGVQTVLPFSGIVAILSGDYDVRTPVTVEQYSIDMKSKMHQIQSECDDA